jgi:ethanolamine utilization protein EutQ (cupin superfamily)
VPHGDHVDYMVEGRLHHAHDGHCDDHGAVELVS